MKHMQKDNRPQEKIKRQGESKSLNRPMSQKEKNAWITAVLADKFLTHAQKCVAVRLATERAIGGVILDAPYTSTADVARGVYWFLPVALLMRDQFRSIDRIGDIKAPLLVMHGAVRADQGALHSGAAHVQGDDHRVAHASGSAAMAGFAVLPGRRNG